MSENKDTEAVCRHLSSGTPNKDDWPRAGAWGQGMEAKLGIRVVMLPPLNRKSARLSQLLQVPQAVDIIGFLDH